MQAGIQRHDESGGMIDEEVNMTISDFQLICANCNGGHSADSPDCPARKDYQILQRKLSNRNRPPPKHEPKEEEHPRRRPAKQSSAVYNGTSYSKALKNGHSAQNQSNGDRNNEDTHGGQSTGPSSTYCPPPGEDLFTIEEINCLMREMLAQLSECKNKADQIRVITHLTLKYVYGHK